nr:energy transducer TonB [Prevotella sp.]
MKKAILSLVMLLSVMSVMGQDAVIGTTIKEGDVAPNIQMKNEKGEDFNLYSLNNGSSYKLLYFWTSTNEECQRSTAVLKLLVDKYWINGVSFIGVNFDTDADAWTKAFTDAKLTRMINVSELKDAASSEGAKAYGITTLPELILIDSSNKLVSATNDINKMVYKLDELDRAGKIVNNAYQTPDQNPEFRGGKAMLMNFLSRNVRYPQKAVQMGAQAKVVVTFVIDKEGKVKDVTATDYELISIGSKDYLRLDDETKEKTKQQVRTIFCDEAERVVSGMPKWTPGMKNGQTLTVKYNLPVTFRMSFAQ